MKVTKFDAASPSNLGGSTLIPGSAAGGDLGGTLPAPTVTGIGGIPVDPPDGVATDYLNGLGHWTVPAGGVSPIPDPGASWAATHAYSLGDRVKDTGTPVGDSGVAVFECIVAGTSGGSNPFGYPFTPMTDATVTWAFIGAIGQLDDRLAAQPTALSTGTNPAVADLSAYNSGSGDASAGGFAETHGAGTATSKISVFNDAGSNLAYVQVTADSAAAHLAIHDGTDTGTLGKFLGSDGAGNAVWATPIVSGAAGGDLSGTYPNPTVSKINGVTVTGVPSPGATIIGTSATTAQWSTGGHVTVYWPMLTLSNQIA